MVHAVTITGKNEHALCSSQPIGELGGIDLQVVAHEGHAAGLWRHEVKEITIGCQPIDHDLKIVPEHRPIAFQDSRPHLGREGDLGNAVAQDSSRDRRVIVIGPRVRDGLCGSSQPPEAKTRQGICLGQPTVDHGLVIHSHKARYFDPIELRTPIDLVGVDPGPDRVRYLDDLPHFLVGQGIARRVVGVADHDHLGLVVDQRAQLIEVRRPAIFFSQVKASWSRAHLLNDAPDLHVVGHHHYHFIPGLEERMTGDEVGLGGAVGDQHVVDVLSLIERSDPLS